MGLAKRAGLRAGAFAGRVSYFARFDSSRELT